jgi:hypothetical protein
MALRGSSQLSFLALRRAGRTFGLFAVFAAAGLSQSFTSLNGNIVDQSGAAVPGAVIEIANVETAAQRSVVADSLGLFVFPQVAPGRYKLTAKAPGFSISTIDLIQLVVNTPATVSVKLEVGAVTNTVSVTAGATQLNTVDASLGNDVTSQAIAELPLDARDPTSLLALQPGVAYFGQESTYGRATTGPIPTADRLNGAVNGSKPDQNNITLDGVDVNDQNTRNAFESVLRVTLDSVQEFRTTTQNPAADQGRGSGAQIALITKSGTNEIHGSLYEYNRNTITEANSFFNNAEGLSRPALNRNIFGASLGGPIRKDRLFFFLNYEGRRDASATTVTQVVPTATFRQGIIQYRDTSGGVTTMNPDQLKQIDPAGIGVDPAVVQVLSQYPLSNDNTVGDGYNTAGYRFQAPTPLRWNTYIARLDYVLDGSGKNTLFWRGNLQNDNVGGTPQFPGQQPATVTLDNAKGFATGWTSILSPGLVSTFHYGLTRSGLETTGIQNSPYVSFDGLATLAATTKDNSRIVPVHQFSEDLSWNRGRHDLRFGGTILLIHNQSTNYGTAYPFGEVTYGYVAGASASLIPPDLNSDFSSAFRTAATTLLGPIALAQVTYNYTLSGQVQSFGSPVKRNYVSNDFELSLGDTWRVSKGFTINLGVRYVLEPAVHEANGYQVSPTIDLGNWFATRGNLANAGLSQTLAGPISFVLANSPQGKPLYDTPKKDFSPRIAFAYSPQGDSRLSKFFFGGPGKTSIRSGFGIFYDLFGMSLMRNFDSNAPGLSTEFQTPSDADLATAARFTGYNQLPLSLLPPAPKGGFPYTPPNDLIHGFAISNSVDQHLKQPYTMNMNFSIGREFSHGLFIQGSYVGRLSRRSLAVSDLAAPTNLRDPKSGITYWQAYNQLEVAARAGLPVSQVKANPFFENLFSNMAGGGLTATQSVYQNVATTFPADAMDALFVIDALCSPCSPVVGADAMLNSQYASLYAYRSTGKGNYHALQWTVRKRFSDGLLFDFNYTFAKSIDLTSNAESDFANSSYGVILNPWNAALNRSVSDFDVQHTFTGFGVYEVPFGKNRRFLSGANKIVDAFIGGWQVSGLYTITSGLPRSVLNTGAWPVNWDFSGFATPVGPVPAPATTRNTPGVNGIGGPNIFSDPSPARAAYDYTYAGGIGQRNGIRGDGLSSVDMSLSKRFIMPYKESHSIQFRWEMFNVPNAVRFDINTASLDVANTGTFGKYTSLLQQPRVMQFGLRYGF